MLLFAQSISIKYLLFVASRWRRRKQGLRWHLFADEPDHLEIVNVLRDDTFKVWFTKNGVLYVVVTLADNEAWLTNLLQSWQFI